MNAATSEPAHIVWSLPTVPPSSAGLTVIRRTLLYTGVAHVPSTAFLINLVVVASVPKSQATLLLAGISDQLTSPATAAILVVHCQV